MANIDRLTAKQRCFVEAYLINANATAAAITAGYSRRTAEQQGYQLLRKPAVAAAIREAQTERSKRTEITSDKILAEVARVAFANIGDFLRSDPDGNIVADLTAVSRDKTAAVAEVIVEEFTSGRGEKARGGRRTRVKVFDKLPALNLLARCLGLLGPGGSKACDLDRGDATAALARITAGVNRSAAQPQPET